MSVQNCTCLQINRANSTTGVSYKSNPAPQEFHPARLPSSKIWLLSLMISKCLPWTRQGQRLRRCCIPGWIPQQPGWSSRLGGVGGSLQTACFQCFKQKNSCQANDQINKTLKTFIWTDKMVTSHVTKFKHHVHFHNANPRPRCFRTTLSQWPFGVYDWWFTNSRIPRFRKGIKN